MRTVLYLQLVVVARWAWFAQLLDWHDSKEECPHPVKHLQWETGRESEIERKREADTERKKETEYDREIEVDKKNNYKTWPVQQKFWGNT